MKKVLCISECCCDLIFGGLETLPNLGEERYGTHFSMQAGGGANTAVLLQRCGVPTAYGTLLGDDDAGRIVRASLENSGLSLIRHEHTPCRTPVSAVLSAQGDRAILDILAAMGAQIGASGGAIRASFAGKPRAISLDMRDTPDLVPTVAVLCAADRQRRRKA